MEGQGSGSITSAFGQIVQGVAGYEAGRYNSRIQQRSADMALRDGVAEEATIRDQARAAMGEQLASQGASGFEVGTGTARDALMESAVNAEMDRLTVRRSARMKSQGFESQAAMSRAKGQTDMVAGWYGAASTLSAPRPDYGGGMSVSGGSPPVHGQPGHEGYKPGGR